jgi:aminopeptidase
MTQPGEQLLREVLLGLLSILCSVQSLWQRGSILAEGQNFSRRLMESPANVVTPTRFTELATEYLGPLENTTLHIR